MSVSVGGWIDVLAGSASLTLSHSPGGVWSPLPGALASYFKLPAFTGTASLGVGGVRLDLDGSATFGSPVVLAPDVVRLIGRPGTSATGIVIGLKVKQVAPTDVAALRGTLEGGVELLGGPSKGGPPVLSVQGELVVGGASVSTLTLRTLISWTPLPELPALVVPPLNGSIWIDALGSTISADVINEPTGKITVVADALSFSAVQLRVMLDPFQPAAAAAGAIPPIAVAASGSVELGTSANPLRCTLGGTLNITARTASLSISHAGNDWSPLRGALSSYFKLPAFTGTARFGIDGVHLAFDGTATFSSGVVLAPGVDASGQVSTSAPPIIKLVAPPTVAGATGMMVGLEVKQVAKTDLATLRATLSAGVELLGGAANGGPPVIDVQGELVLADGGVSSLTLRTDAEWQPLPQLIPALRVPTLWGRLNMTVSGASASMQVYLTHGALASFTIVPDALSFDSFRLAFEMPPFEFTTSAASLRVILAECTARIGGLSGVSVSVGGWIDVSAGSMYLQLSHAGGLWSLFPTGHALRSLFILPSFTGVCCNLRFL